MMNPLKPYGKSCKSNICLSSDWTESEIFYPFNLPDMFCSSSTEALEMLLKFKHMKTRKAIQEQLMTKFDLIMQQFSKEVSNIEHIFTVECQ